MAISTLPMEKPTEGLDVALMGICGTPSALEIGLASIMSQAVAACKPLGFCSNLAVLGKKTGRRGGSLLCYRRVDRHAFCGVFYVCDLLATVPTYGRQFWERLIAPVFPIAHGFQTRTLPPAHFGRCAGRLRKIAIGAYEMLFRIAGGMAAPAPLALTIKESQSRWLNPDSPLNCRWDALCGVLAAVCALAVLFFEA